MSHFLNILGYAFGIGLILLLAAMAAILLIGGLINREGPPY